ncbi:MAG: PhoU domain-containing protein [Akkermansia sp.]
MLNEPHSLREFDRAMQGVNDTLTQMASYCLTAMDSAFDAVLSRCEEAANRTIADDDQIDNCELILDRQILEIQASFGPVAGDLRIILTAMNLSTPLERIGDECVGIARKALLLIAAPTIRDVLIVEPVYLKMRGLLSNLMDSFLSKNFIKAKKCLATCDELETDAGILSEKMILLAEKEPGSIASFSQLVLIARSMTNMIDKMRRICVDILSMEDEQGQ